MDSNITDKQQIKDKIQQLVDKYEKVLSERRTGGYTEEETKKDFILPLFECLGWDVENKNEVSAEEHQSSGRVDYGFYLNGRIKFYLEAKSLRADLNREEYANQAIKYSWNKGVTWAILTDFESIKIFNAQDINESLFSKLYFEIKYDQLLECFDQLWLLSKEAFEENLIDKEAEKVGKKLQKISVGEQLYKTLNECRNLLINRLGAWNDIKDKNLLDEGVQKLLDRLIFIRVAEDRGIEEQTLIPLIRESENSRSKNEAQLYEAMVSKFRELDEIYNSNLFSPHPFETWKEHSGATEKVIKLLYGKPGYYEYDFKIIPADILGAVYENYLGHRLSQSKKGVSVDKDSKKRKEQGIYYTPSFIVDYIVENTLKPVLDNCKSISDLKKIKVLDPACGSGSFLIKALDMINEKYKEFGSKNDQLNKIMILQENIYGVDLDEQAIEIARLNLLINTLSKRIKLPNLAKNIKNGNSLISGTDEELEKYFGKYFKEKKPFNWGEAFPEVFKQGGFDVIIGNPPYINMYTLEEDEINFFKNKFKLALNYFDLFALFVEQSIKNLKNDGNIGFIIPSLFLKGVKYSSLREYININSKDLFVKEMGDNVFVNVSMPTCIINLKKGKNEFKNNYFENKIDLFHKKQTINLGDISYVKRGIEIGQDKLVDKGIVKCISGRDIDRYIIKSSRYINAETLTLYRKSEDIFLPPKLLVRETGSCIITAYDKQGIITTRSLYNVKINDSSWILFVLGILNSNLYKFYFRTYISPDTKVFPKIRIEQLKNIPIILSKEYKNIIISLVSKIIKLNLELQDAAENSNEWVSLKEEIKKIDKKIDEEVYKLYDLTPEEIAVVEKS